MYVLTKTMMENKRKGIGYFVGVAVLIFCMGLLFMQVTQAMLGGKSPQTTYAQRSYDAAVYNLCVAEQALANAKLADYFDGFINLSDEDVLRLKSKKEQDCPF